MKDLVTLYIVAFFVVGLIIWDVYTLVKRGSNTTISVQLHGISKEYPIIPFLIGVVFGHIFWPL